jgi:hypothetical protein
MSGVGEEAWCARQSVHACVCLLALHECVPAGAHVRVAHVWLPERTCVRACVWLPERTCVRACLIACLRVRLGRARCAGPAWQHPGVLSRASHAATRVCGGGQQPGAGTAGPFRRHTGRACLRALEPQVGFGGGSGWWLSLWLWLLWWWWCGGVGREVFAVVIFSALRFLCVCVGGGWGGVRGAGCGVWGGRDVKETVELLGESGKTVFQFDRVFGPAARQVDVFAEVLPVLQVPASSERLYMCVCV